MTWFYSNARAKAHIWIKRFIIRAHYYRFESKYSLYALITTDLNQKILYTRSLLPIWIKRFFIRAHYYRFESKDSLYALITTDLNLKIHKSCFEDSNQTILYTRSLLLIWIKRFMNLAPRIRIKRFSTRAPKICFELKDSKKVSKFREAGRRSEM